MDSTLSLFNRKIGYLTGDREALVCSLVFSQFYERLVMSIMRLLMSIMRLYFDLLHLLGNQISVIVGLIYFSLKTPYLFLYFSIAGLISATVYVHFGCFF